MNKLITKENRNLFVVVTILVLLRLMFPVYGCNIPEVTYSPKLCPQGPTVSLSLTQPAPVTTYLGEVSFYDIDYPQTFLQVLVLLILSFVLTALPRRTPRAKYIKEQENINDQEKNVAQKTSQFANKPVLIALIIINVLVALLRAPASPEGVFGTLLGVGVHIALLALVVEFILKKYKRLTGKHLLFSFWNISLAIYFIIQLMLF